MELYRAQVQYGKNIPSCTLIFRSNILSFRLIFYQNIFILLKIYYTRFFVHANIKNYTSRSLIEFEQTDFEFTSELFIYFCDYPGWNR